MSKIKFSDGVEFNIDDNNYHLTRRPDGWYVVGRNTLCPVNSYEEGHLFITELEEMSKLRALSQLNDSSD